MYTSWVHVHGYTLSTRIHVITHMWTLIGTHTSHHICVHVLPETQKDTYHQLHMHTHHHICVHM